jgi:hypothetical protein
MLIQRRNPTPEKKVLIKKDTLRKLETATENKIRSTPIKTSIPPDTTPTQLKKSQDKK